MKPSGTACGKEEGLLKINPARTCMTALKNAAEILLLRWDFSALGKKIAAESLTRGTGGCPNYLLKEMNIYWNASEQNTRSKQLKRLQ